MLLNPVCAPALPLQPRGSPRARGNTTRAPPRWGFLPHPAACRGSQRGRELKPWLRAELQSERVSGKKPPFPALLRSW